MTVELPWKSPGYGVLRPVKAPFDDGAAVGCGTRLALGLAPGLARGGALLAGRNNEPARERRSLKMLSDMDGMESTVAKAGRVRDACSGAPQPAMAGPRLQEGRFGSSVLCPGPKRGTLVGNECPASGVRAQPLHGSVNQSLSLRPRNSKEP